MAVSNSSDYNQTRNEIIADSLTLLGVYRPGATVSSADYAFCSNILNKIVKDWEGQGIKLFTQEEGILILTDGKSTYTLSASTTDKVGMNPVQTALTADCSSTSATVASTVGMTATDNISIALDDNTIHSTTIVSVDSSTALTLTAAPASTASSGNSVYTYTSAVGRALYITSARLQSSSGVEREIEVMGHTQFMSLPNKQVEGSISAIHYAPKVSSGTLYVYQVPSDVNECIRFTYARSIMDFDNSTDNPDFPQEWLYALTANLAVRLASTYGKDVQKTNPQLVLDAGTSLLQLQLFDTDEGSTFIVPRERYDD